jgi:peptide/nickel transport system permease protein
MSQYILKRLFFSLITLIGITFFVFLTIHLIPGDPVEIIAGGEADEPTKAQIRKSLGLDEPLAVQYIAYMAGLIRGDLGRSLWTRKPVISEVWNRAAATLELGIFGLIISIAIAIPAGVISATRPSSLVDYCSMAVSFLGVSMPAFWVGILLMMAFSIEFPLFPAMGRGEPLLSAIWQVFQGNFEPFGDSLRHLILPAVTLGLFNAAFIARMTRSSMLEVLNQDYIRTARSKGLAEFKVVYKHAFRNALLPIITVVGMQFGYLLGGAVLTESVFAWPGLGRFIVESILARDYPFIQGALLFFGTAFLLVNLLTDILYSYINPRVRVE